MTKRCRKSNLLSPKTNYYLKKLTYKDFSNNTLYDVMSKKSSDLCIIFYISICKTNNYNSLKSNIRILLHPKLLKQFLVLYHYKHFPIQQKVPHLKGATPVYISQQYIKQLSNRFNPKTIITVNYKSSQINAISKL